MKLTGKQRHGIVKVDGIWRYVVGEIKGYDFNYILNGKLRVALDGSFQSFDDEFSQKEIQAEVIRLNIRDIKSRRRR